MAEEARIRQHLLGEALPRLYPVLDTGALAARGIALAVAAEAMLDAGARILQVRHKGHFTRGVFAETEQAAELCRRFGALFIVDDRADIAALVGAGVHLGQEDLRPSEVRGIVGSDAVIGYSTHNDEQLREAESEPADYLALGPVFATGSKERPDPVVGVERFGEWRRLTKKPLVAIGGITRENAAEVLAVGADSVAVIANLLPETATPDTVRRRMEEWLRTVQP